METNEDLKYRIYTQRAEADKAINSLRGILKGINLDRKINDAELLELDNWAEDHWDLINKNPFREFLVTIRERLREDEDLNDAIEDLYWLSQKYEDDNIYYNAVTADLQTLQGLCHGILADGEINDTEVKELQKWMYENQHLSTYYPYDELFTVLNKVLADGVVDEKEKLHLKAHFNCFVKLTDKELTEKIKDEVADTKITGLCTSNPIIEIDGKKFCLTGKLTRGVKSDLEELIQDNAGIISSSVTKDTNYLIVGDNGNPAWAFSCYGRKVEAAIKLRKSGSNIQLVHEYDFWDYLDDLR